MPGFASRRPFQRPAHSTGKESSMRIGSGLLTLIIVVLVFVYIF